MKLVGIAAVAKVSNNDGGDDTAAKSIMVATAPNFQNKGAADQGI